MKNVIFAKRFFRLNARDQAAVVEAELRDIEKNYGRYVSPKTRSGRGGRRPASGRRRFSPVCVQMGRAEE